MGLASVAPRRNTRDAIPAPVYRDLLRDRAIGQPNQVWWCADLTYMPMAHVFIYVVAIMG